LVSVDNDKPTVLALREIAEGLIDASILTAKPPSVELEELTDEAADAVEKVGEAAAEAEEAVEAAATEEASEEPAKTEEQEPPAAEA